MPIETVTFTNREFSRIRKETIRNIRKLFDISKKTPSKNFVTFSGIRSSNHKGFSSITIKITLGSNNIKLYTTNKHSIHWVLSAENVITVKGTLIKNETIWWIDDTPLECLSWYKKFLTFLEGGSSK